MQIFQNNTTQPIVFAVKSSSDHYSAHTGATPDVILYKNGGSSVAPTGSVTSLGAGLFSFNPAPVDVNTVGSLWLYATASGADPAWSQNEVIVHDLYSREGVPVSGTIVASSGVASYAELPIVPMAPPGNAMWSLTFSGQTTSSMAWDVSNADLASALVALSNIGGAGGNVSVTGSIGAWSVEFTGSLANTNVDEMTANVSGFDNRWSISVVMATVTPGSVDETVGVPTWSGNHTTGAGEHFFYGSAYYTSKGDNTVYVSYSSWAGSTPYAVDQVVDYTGNFYRCKQTIPYQSGEDWIYPETSDSAYWDNLGSSLPVDHYEGPPNGTYWELWYPTTGANEVQSITYTAGSNLGIYVISGNGTVASLGVGTWLPGPRLWRISIPDNLTDTGSFYFTVGADPVPVGIAVYSVMTPVGLTTAEHNRLMVVPTTTPITATDVWNNSTRTLSNSDIVWNNSTRTLSDVSGIVSGVWGAGTRTLTAAASISAADVWTYTSRTLSASPLSTGDVQSACGAAITAASLSTAASVAAVYAIVSTNSPDIMATAVMNSVIETGVTFRQATQRIGATTAGKVAGAGTGTETFKGMDGITTRVIVAVDSSGNRTSIGYV